MKNILQDNTDKISTYIDCKSEFALLEFKKYFFNLMEDSLDKFDELVFLCIGTDKATGDSLGPLVGYKLSKLPMGNNVFIYGTLDNPVHAKNLVDTIQKIYKRHKNPFLVAIDASLGDKKNINFISLGKGGLKAGAGVKKNLPIVGDMYIKGIVNHTGILEYSVLQHTRLSLVMNMADIISNGIWHCVSGIK